MNTETKPTYKNPILWVPSSYFAMGTVYTMVTTAANILFANLGLPNDQSALYSSLTGFAFTLKSCAGALHIKYLDAKNNQVDLDGIVAKAAFTTTGKPLKILQLP